VASLLVAMAACSSQPLKCHGSLRPINSTAEGAKVVSPGINGGPSEAHTTPRDAPPGAHRNPRPPLHPEPHL
jgi:hypothetical protein